MHLYFMASLLPTGTVQVLLSGRNGVSGLVRPLCQLRLALLHHNDIIDISSFKTLSVLSPSVIISLYFLILLWIIIMIIAMCVLMLILPQYSVISTEYYNCRCWSKKLRFIIQCHASVLCYCQQNSYKCWRAMCSIDVTGTSNHKLSRANGQLAD